MDNNVEAQIEDSATKDPKLEESVASIANDETPRSDHGINLDQISEEISQFVASLPVVDESHPLETPKCVEIFLEKIDSELQYYESMEPSSSSKFDPSSKDHFSFFKAIDALALLVESISKFKSISSSASILHNLASSQLHQAMLVLEDELRILLHKWKNDPPAPAPPNDNNSQTDSNSHKDQHQDNQSDHCLLPDRSDSNQQQQDAVETFPGYSSQDISIMSLISKTMISSGYGDECIKLFMMVRQSAFEQELTSQGLEKMSIDDVQKMNWESLAGEIDTWIRILKHCISNLFPGEVKFYQSIFSSALSEFHPNSKIGMVLFSNLAGSVIHQLINLANSVSMTKRSSEKLFKFLDMYETLRELGSWLDDSSFLTEDWTEDLRFELQEAKNSLGEAAVLIFYELESSIKSDIAKNPVPNGAVHPLTRYTMNYLKYACEYKDSLEELFQKHSNGIKNEEEEEGKDANQTPFRAQLMTIMDLLDTNLENKSKLYRDPSLRYIFLMNNGRYILQKIKGSTEIHQAMGDPWCRKRSSDLRSYHKNYQRDTWSRVLQCLSQHEGLVVNGKVQKLVLKERFKNFNQQFDEIHRTQSTWVISDEQLRSELRVSISAVMIPAYRAFLARFGQIFTPGRQYEKHIKYQPDDIETAIEELFDGNATSMVRRRP